ncbi:hypothetical protein Adt_34575 [Abeliophyllum distichum]|uniref:Uncharacterized protein n=1 Tax=Abeliophyllum distichum TaxID=126358 RepID=A0ABD1QZH5_9LAMI
MRMMEETLRFYSSNNRGGVDRLFIPPRKLCAASVPPKNPNRSSGFFTNNTHRSFEHLQATQLQQLKEQQMMKQPQQGSRFCGQMKSGYQQMVLNSGGPNGLAMDAWSTVQHPQKQQQPGSGMRALFLGDPATKNERSGTGVFLPRRFGTPTETRKKSDVFDGLPFLIFSATECIMSLWQMQGVLQFLLPDRVVQALNLNLESMDSQPQPQPPNRSNGNFIPDYAAAVKYRNNVVMAHQRKNQRQAAMTNQDLRLPQEWTY